MKEQYIVLIQQRKFFYYYLYKKIYMYEISNKYY